MPPAILADLVRVKQMIIENRRAPESEELFAAHGRYLRSLRTVWAESRIASLSRQLSSGWLFSLSLPESSPGEILALADRASGRGLRIHAIQVSRPSSDRLNDFLLGVDRSSNGPLLAVSDLLEGISADAQKRLFEGRGFWHREMILMELGERASLPPVPKEHRFRPLVPGDRAGFVSSYARVYAEPQGDYWLDPSADVEADARKFFDQFLEPSGTWNEKIIRDASLVYEADGRVVGSVLVGRTRAGQPHVFGLEVDPAFQRRGIGRALLLQALHRLRADRRGPVTLSVIRNDVAHRLYSALGFRLVPPPAGLLPGYWVRTTGVSLETDRR
jgi:ribosomal protein S18 acetylase RimI-like enzyme